MKKLEQLEVRERLPSFDAESFIFRLLSKNVKIKV
jgi:hypothetical protein